MVTIKRTPTNPRRVEDWKAGTLPGAAMHFKYEYGKANKPEDKSLSGICRLWAGVMTEDKTARVPETLGWRDLAVYNYGTDDPGEINWYKDNFNGSKDVAPDGDLLFGPGDANPFLYLPVVPVGGGTTVAVPAGGSVAVKLPPPQSDFTRAALRRFSEVSDGKGFATKSRLRATLNADSFTGADAAAMTAMVVHYSALEDLSDDELGPETNGVTRADLAAFDRQWNRDASHKTVAAVLGTFGVAQAKISGAGSALYAAPTIDTLTVTQGFVNDCWLLAALVGMGARADAAVRAMIKPSGREFNVTFADAPAPVLIPRPTDGQLAMLGATSGNGLWLTVLEVAYGTREGPGDPIDAVDTMSLQSRGIKPLTNHESTTDTLITTMDSTTRKKLTKAFTDGKIVVTGIINTIRALWEDSPRRNGWPMAHVYTVMAFNPLTDKVRIRNPWNHTVGAGAGKEVEWSEFTESFSSITCED